MKPVFYRIFQTLKEFQKIQGSLVLSRSRVLIASVKKRVMKEKKNIYKLHFIGEMYLT